MTEFIQTLYVYTGFRSVGNFLLGHGKWRSRAYHPWSIATKTFPTKSRRLGKTAGGRLPGRCLSLTTNGVSFYFSIAPHQCSTTFSPRNTAMHMIQFDGGFFFIKLCMYMIRFSFLLSFSILTSFTDFSPSKGIFDLSSSRILVTSGNSEPQLLCVLGFRLFQFHNVKSSQSNHVGNPKYENMCNLLISKCRITMQARRDGFWSTNVIHCCTTYCVKSFLWIFFSSSTSTTSLWNSPLMENEKRIGHFTNSKFGTKIFVHSKWQIFIRSLASGRWFRTICLGYRNIVTLSIWSRAKVTLSGTILINLLCHVPHCWQKMFPPKIYIPK